MARRAWEDDLLDPQSQLSRLEAMRAAQREAKRIAELPMSVKQAEAIIEEERKREMAVIQDAMADVCDHDGFVIYTTTDSPFDDHSTDAGYCHGCNQWLVATAWKTGRDVEWSVMSDAQKEALQRIEDKYQGWRD